MNITLTQIYQIGLNIIFLILIYYIVRIITKQWVYDASYKASYDALAKYEKDQREKDVMNKVQVVRNKYK